ncbi:MAG: hypothetical protein KVP17_004491 [Porospora cf. gigantea B]|uniref:uncharacterized protein n=1 Tax=Porospora cf. gigantea B TaxID=2853592 RepID=UPI003571AAFD|nr:MAG: hypothetical protein KVP17_004491 [Porospora cf. gigantea B]
MQYPSNCANFLEPRQDDKSSARPVGRRDESGYERREAKRIDMSAESDRRPRQPPSGFTNIKLGRQNNQHSGGAIAEYAAMAKETKW